MSTELEHLLRGGMERFTDDARVPEGLALKAYRHRQKRRTTVRVVTAAGTATVLTTGALTAAGVAGAFGSASGHQVQSTQVTADAYVVTRVEQALGQPDLNNVLGETRTVYEPGTSVQPLGPGGVRVSANPGVSSPWSAAYELRWTYHGTLKMSTFTATGQRVFDLGVSVDNGTPHSVAVIYRNSTWWRETPTRRSAGRAGPPPSSCGPDVELGAGPGNGWPTFIRGELICGEYTVAGHQLIDGINAVKITGNKGLDTLWVSPSTYLPVRAILGLGGERLQTDFSWLAPTPANLAQLKVTVPAGFRQVPAP
jgi:hypothetical protein